MNEGKWRLPHGVDELLPPAASELEQLRRTLLDLFASWGYEHIEPPVIEYLDSLLVGSGQDLDLQTLKVIDQRTGRMLGVRADMTSQAVRVDAHSRPQEGVQRLCYAGPVVFANPSSALDRRNPYKAGAELFGCAGLEADAEVIRLMLASLAAGGVEDPVLLLGHMGIYRALVAELGVPADVEVELFSAVQRKSEADIGQLVGGGAVAELLVALPTMMGDVRVLEEMRTRFKGAPEGVHAAVTALETLADQLSNTSTAEIRFDLSELAGYGYHNGPVFAAFHRAQGASLAQGGRYDDIGAHFGRGRPATGFDVRLHRLLSSHESARAIWSPLAAGANSDLDALVKKLREQGEIVVSALTENDEVDPRCHSELVEQGGSWQLQER